MRAVVQRVNEASVSVAGQTVGSVGNGLLVYLGVMQDDTLLDVQYLADKLLQLRIFDDAQGKTNLAAADVQGEFLIVSQFTLYADCRKGNRPSFTDAGNPQLANELYEYIIDSVRAKGFHTEHGSFGADMKVSLLNDGPFTIMLDSDELVK